MMHGFVSLALLPLLISPVLQGNVEEGSPNVIFILADDVGIGDIKCFYPLSKVTTRNIDRLALEGMKFNQAYSPGATCSPSRYALISGSYPCRGPLRSEAVNGSTPLTIGEDEFSLPRFFKQQGYRTAHIGKWHLGYGGKGGITNWAGEIKPSANEIGFDYHFALPTNHNDGFKTYVENHRLLWLKDGIDELLEKPTLDQLTQIRYDDLGESTLTEKGIAFIKENHDRPFFLYLAFTATHTHITPHKKFRGSSEIGQLGDYINELDFHVGEIMDTLEELGIDENTILFFSSDNGGSPRDHRTAGINLSLHDSSQGVGEKAKTAKADAAKKFGHLTNGALRGSKGSNFEGGHRVPFLVRWPSRIAAGSESDQLITLADTLATCAGLLNRKLPGQAGRDSFDLSSVMLGEELETPREEVILQTNDGSLAFRQGNWKLRFSEPTVWEGVEPELPTNCELYHLLEDPSEERDLAAVQHRRVKVMTGRLMDLLSAGRSRGR